MYIRIAVINMVVLAKVEPEESSTSANLSVKNNQSVEAEKTIIAIQGFIDPVDSDKIMRLCTGLSDIEGYHSDLERSFIPHVTLASWKVTPDELEVAASQYQDRLTGMNRISARVHLVEKEKDRRFVYHLVPEITQPLLEFHSTLHKKLDWHFEPFRQIDLPGSWMPHLTLFSIPIAQKPSVAEALRNISEIKSITIERIGFLDLSPARITKYVELNQIGDVG